jgi:hypothetical protein
MFALAVGPNGQDVFEAIGFQGKGVVQVSHIALGEALASGRNEPVEVWLSVQSFPGQQFLVGSLSPDHQIIHSSLLFKMNDFPVFTTKKNAKATIFGVWIQQPSRPALEAPPGPSSLPHLPLQSHASLDEVIAALHQAGTSLRQQIEAKHEGRFRSLEGYLNTKVFKKEAQDKNKGRKRQRHRR